MKIVVNRQTIKKINSLKEVDKLCTRIHTKISKIDCCRAKRNLRTFEVKKVEFLSLIGFLKDLLLKMHANFFLRSSRFEKIRQKIKNLTPSTHDKCYK